MATPRRGGLPSPNVSLSYDRQQSPGTPRNRASNSSIPPPEAGRGLEAAAITELLTRGQVYLTGGRDKSGGPVLTFPTQPQIVQVPAQELSTCVHYFAQIPSRESRRQGFTALVDNRNGCWANLSIVLASLQSVGKGLKQLLVISSGSSSERRLHANFRREKTNLDFEPQFIAINQLYAYIDSHQLTPAFGGSLPFNYESWLQNRQELEAFLRNVHTSSQQLENAESQISRSLQLDEKASPKEILRRHQYLQDSIMTTPTKVLRHGREVLNQLQREGEGGFKTRDSGVTTLDNLEAQRQLKRMIQYLENKVEKVQDFLEDQDEALSDNVKFTELETAIKKVVNWILGPGEKLLGSQVDIGESWESAEELRRRHEEIELKCTKTYGEYAEFRHAAEEMLKLGHVSAEDIVSQRDYMDTVCRSFATRLERRRTLLINSVRFHRLSDQFSQKLDVLLELLCTDVDIEDVTTAEAAIKTLQENCDSVDNAAEGTLMVGQSLLDELSIPVKNAFGKDITPDYDKHIKYISKKLEDLQERKMRCDELADVRRLKLQQILQLRTCERDADQAINWINELCDTMVASQDMGQPAPMPNQNIESTAVGTYEYGKQLLQAALVLRRSLRHDLEPNQERSYQLEAAWKRFSQGTNEQANRQTVATAYMNTADKLLNQIEQLNHVLRQPQGLSPGQIKTKYGPVREAIIKGHKETEKMSAGLLDRLSQPILSFEGRNKRLSIDDEGSRDTIRNKQRRINKKMTEQEKLWSKIGSQISPSQPGKISQSMSNLSDTRAGFPNQNGRHYPADPHLQAGSLRDLPSGIDRLDGGTISQSSPAFQTQSPLHASQQSYAPYPFHNQSTHPGLQRSSSGNLPQSGSQRSSLARSPLPGSPRLSMSRSPFDPSQRTSQQYSPLSGSGSPRTSLPQSPLQGSPRSSLAPQGQTGYSRSPSGQQTYPGHDQSSLSQSPLHGSPRSSLAPQGQTGYSRSPSGQQTYPGHNQSPLAEQPQPPFESHERAALQMSSPHDSKRNSLSNFNEDGQKLLSEMEQVYEKRTYSVDRDVRNGSNYFVLEYKITLELRRSPIV